MKNTGDNLAKRRILVTGGAGFIGSHLVDSLLVQNNQVVVLDNFNNYYDPGVKRHNIEAHERQKNYTLIEGDLRDDEALASVFSHGPFDTVVHLAAMAGVRPSLENPSLYMDVNLNGTQKLLDQIVKSRQEHKAQTRLVFGSSSSVYGKRSGECFLETDPVDQPLSPYAASKAAGELICYACHHTTGLPIIALRFFTVFGPRQRPDLAIHKFCKLIDHNEPIEVYGDGQSKRDYTYVGDIVFGITSAISYDLPGFDIINLGRSEPVILMDMIRCLESNLGKKANLIHRPMQLGDVPYTYAGIDKARQVLGYQPSTGFEEGMRKFVAWYRQRKSVSSPVPY